MDIESARVCYVPYVLYVATYGENDARVVAPPGECADYYGGKVAFY